MKKLEKLCIWKKSIEKEVEEHGNGLDITSFEAYKCIICNGKDRYCRNYALKGRIVN